MKHGDRTITRHVRLRPAVFGSREIPQAKDVVFVERKHIGDARWYFSATTIKQSGLSEFKRCLESIPPIKEGMEVLKEGRQFSSRYTFRPYALTAKLWVEDEKSLAIPPDLRSFILGAINYLLSGEWRTSIVLSAIAVESVLADVYEGKYRRFAPDTPLGDLFIQVKNKARFPDNLVSAIESANNARIAAVHRSRLPVSEREAINALFGAVNIARWHLLEYDEGNSHKD